MSTACGRVIVGRSNHKCTLVMGEGVRCVAAAKYRSLASSGGSKSATRSNGTASTNESAESVLPSRSSTARMRFVPSGDKANRFAPIFSLSSTLWVPSQLSQFVAVEPAERHGRHLHLEAVAVAHEAVAKHLAGIT